MTSHKPVELNEQQIDMVAALQEDRVLLRQHASVHTAYPYAVLANGDTETLGFLPGAEVWFVNAAGDKAEPTMPLPLFVRAEELRALGDDPELERQLRARIPAAPLPTAVDAFLQFAEQAQRDFIARGQHDQAEATGQFRSYLQRFGLPGADDQLRLLSAVTRTTDALRKVFRDTCEQKPFPRGSECDDKLQALCEGDIALQTVGQRDTTWTPEKVTVAARQGWRITPANDGTAGLTITAVPGGRLAGDIAAYEFVCAQAKRGDLLALTACKETGIRITEVNDYKPPVLGM
ncbi:hypothetical protein [Cupriavidus pampae]|uniref:Uncharacterized protein n=1 Tax=Cupriavidus pampae TaxID=659251 RepID=A0ABN7ZEF5_9BURK|nr:hypothetical protein [Cupriavidus pampae]CAG9184337.1 hypothetical protein LMG32289_05589 [Cupriavidus pampae]